MIRALTATVECDECSVVFKVDADTAQSIPDGWSGHDVAEDAIRGGHLADSGSNSPSVTDDGRHLCPKCTEQEDARPTQDPRHER